MKNRGASHEADSHRGRRWRHLTTVGCGTSEEEQQAAEIAEERGAGCRRAPRTSRKVPRPWPRAMSDLASGLGAAFGGDPNAKPVDPVSFRDLQARAARARQDGSGENPTGERMTAPVNFAEASVTHTKGDATISTKITDSALNQMLVAPFAMFLAGNYERETDRGYEKSIKIGESAGLRKVGHRGQERRPDRHRQQAFHRRDRRPQHRQCRRCFTRYSRRPTSRSSPI